MKRILKWIAIVIAVLIVIALALPFLIDVNTFRPQIESQLTDALGRKVSVGNLKLSILSGSLGAAGRRDSRNINAKRVRSRAANRDLPGWRLAVFASDGLRGIAGG